MNSLRDLAEIFFSFKIEKDQRDIDCLKRALFKFCDTGKKEDAFSVYFCFCEIFEIFGSGYDTMSKLIEFLSDHELHSGELLTKHRDHYSHSVYVFALGLSIYANDKKFNSIINDFYAENGFNDTKFLYLWGLTALFHDLGYPFQLAHEQIKAYVGSLWGENNENNPYVSYENMGNVLELNKKIDIGGETREIASIGELLAIGINYRLGYPLNLLTELLQMRYAHQQNFMDHGYFSAVLLANRLSKSNVELDCYLIDVLTSIALHNSINRFDIKNKIGDSSKISPYKHPLAYLLILCDELQNWDRTAFGYVSKKDPLAWKIDLSIKESGIFIRFYFDSFSVIDSDKLDIDGKRLLKDEKEAFLGEERSNKNVEKLQGENNKFVQDIYSLINPHTDIFADAIEEKKDKKTRLFASSDDFVNLCDFAVAIHKSYQSVFKGPDFKDLSLEFKLSNIEQAKSYADKLELINCFYSDKELDFPIVKGFTYKNVNESEKGKRDDLGFLAREEHLRWVREKLDAGWHYGKDYETTAERNAKKIHKDIIPYDCLPEDETKKDELMIKNMVPLLYKYGHGVRIYSYRSGWKESLDIAGCGHRTIPMDNEDLKEKVKDILREYQKHYRVVVRTNFAFGADQLIAQCANELGITIKAAIPFEYEKYIEKIKEDAKKYKYKFTEQDELNMRHLLAQCVSCKVKPDETYGYLEASKYIINKSKKLIALWDGVETILKDEKGNPINQGGTWHNICIAKESRGLKDDDIHIIKCER